MIDTTQILLISAITIMTVIFTIVGIQLIFVLRDVRVLVTKANRLINEFEHIGGSLQHNFGEVMGFLSGIKNMIRLLEALKKQK